MLYMVTWIPSIYPLDVSIYTSTMDPMGWGFPGPVWWHQERHIAELEFREQHEATNGNDSLMTGGPKSIDWAMPPKKKPKNHGGKAGIIRNHISMSMRGWILRYPANQIPTCPKSWSLVADHELRRSKPIFLRNNQLDVCLKTKTLFKYI